MTCDNKKLTHAERERIIDAAERREGRSLTEEEKSRLIHEAERAHRSCRKDDNDLFKYLMYALGLALAGLLAYYLFRNMRSREEVRPEPTIATQQLREAEQAAAVAATTPVVPAETTATTPARPIA